MDKKIQILSELANAGLITAGLTFDEGLERYNERFSKLILEECAKIAEANGHSNTATEIRNIE
jgi:hypothetical protein